MANLNHFDFNIEVRPVTIGAGLNGWYQIVRCEGDRRIPVTDWLRVPGKPAGIVHHAVRSARQSANAHLTRLG
ncbi:hypothetical protein [Silvimonas iriomotensis]|uniref:Uncharacterized protein n=1 Tax=Silvimonas iriomotensis TaxID=449662 RepID=A0ABQ2PA75_9NEIS|nr:hypothetical protein [Silvimonas iriomotensis]GGP22176.1 hypothetical protein GCM10010970_23930 [Silvimonas iriomotensis]